MVVKRFKEGTNEWDTIAMMNDNEEIFRNKDRDLFILLEEIVDQEDIEALDYYISKGYDINVRHAARLITIMHSLEYTSVSFVQEMLSRGANLCALSIIGETPLLALAKDGKNIELQKFLIEKGLNPYNCDSSYRNCFEYSKIRKKPEAIGFYEQSVFNESDKTFDDYVKLRDYKTALSYSLTKIENLGGLSMVLDKLNYAYVYKAVIDLQNALSLNGMYNEANLIQKSILKVLEKFSLRMEEVPPNFISSFIEQDEQCLYHTLDYLIESNSENSMITYYLLMGLCISKILNLPERERVFWNRIQVRPIPDTYCMKEIVSLFNEDNTLEHPEIIETIITKSKSFSERSNSELSFLLALVLQVKGDYIYSELLYRRILDISMESRFLYKEFIYSVQMINYLEANIQANA